MSHNINEKDTNFDNKLISDPSDRYRRAIKALEGLKDAFYGR
jgi:hypothetical protein